jgi:hypothetical protein
MGPDSLRYRALKKWLLENGVVVHHALAAEETEPFVTGENFYGETFEAAVDSLPPASAEL